jgi:hypothetical protein
MAAPRRLEPPKAARGSQHPTAAGVLCSENAAAWLDSSWFGSRAQHRIEESPSRAASAVFITCQELRYGTFGLLRRVCRSRPSGTPFGVPNDLSTDTTGGFALLNPRLPSANPPGWSHWVDASRRQRSGTDVIGSAAPKGIAAKRRRRHKTGFFFVSLAPFRGPSDCVRRPRMQLCV